MNPRPLQRGISLVVVLVIVLLCTMLALGALRTALLGEMATGHDSDHQRAFASANALLRAAEAGIPGGPADGSACRAAACVDPSAPDIRAGQALIPGNLSQWQDLQAALDAATPSCAAGICIPDRVPEQFWLDRTALDAMKRVAAGPEKGPRRAWYWVELLPYDMAAAGAGGPAETLAPDPAAPFIYRITVVAQGRKAGTQAVIQTTLVRQTRSTREQPDGQPAGHPDKIIRRASWRQLQ
jgi:type IV pilus assembly protein PilX